MILTTDNSRDKHLQDIGGCKDDIANLRMIADIKISELKLDDCPNLLVFPRDFTECDDKIGEENIFSLNGDLLKTNNIMGFVGIDKTQVTIKSRFAWDDNEDYFLHYMLQKVFSINLFNLPHNFAEESIFDFLLYLFPLYLKRALRQGLFKEYQRRCYNDANVRGVIDINRHIRFNIPFAGRVAYNTREYSYDNHVTQLIRHTIEFIRMHKFCGNILNSDEKIKEDVSLITSATPTYERNNRQNIINQNLRPLRHPYFSDYIMLQHLCLQILRHEQIKYGVEKDKIYGILFDGAWLWKNI
jgi:5-methylcytosine-specific restriction enzyme subunit McrC